jgi:hypothetical protein
VISVIAAAVPIGVASLLVSLWLTAPLASEQPLVRAAMAYPLSFTGDWKLWSGAVRESGLIAGVGSGLIAVASLMRRTM